MFIFKKRNLNPFNNLNKTTFGRISLNGKVSVPGDKSISQRALIIGLISLGQTSIQGILDSEDVFYTMKAVEALGGKISIDKKNKSIILTGVGLGNLMSPKRPIYMGNSGTGTRLLIGLVAGSNATVTFYGDESLSNRPMDRIIKPLEKMGAKFISSKYKTLPITIIGARNKGFTMPIEYKTPVASAQIKSAIIFSALTAKGTTTIKEPSKTRNYTEKMLNRCGVKIQSKINKNQSNTIKVKGVQYLNNSHFTIPGDPSSATFIVVACLITKGSRISIQNVLNDPMRLKIFKVLMKMGGKIILKKISNNLLHIEAESSILKNLSLNKNDAMPLIDEFPILSIAAACGLGKMKMKGLGELRFKESDRFLAIEEGLKKCGVKVNTSGDDMEITGNKEVMGDAKIEAKNDHRIAMAFNVLSLISIKPIQVKGNKSINTSFPDFFNIIKLLVKKTKI